ncbi:hypothetical protein DAPPUDRAFT_238776 [Daphnia pulex]|uniref:Uncharacterized protein n=1 Tax=Daphnia pulex TaxID=6669 RepID=E9G7C8_DAPPU|nr:hypothetical protein DAPPUDRAFT_238776 [Daphnia pulex]|eukprot:EFX84445.1 hypothetical protein DAPPUDRAFT_238776 [Daphnia pulex]
MISGKWSHPENTAASSPSRKEWCANIGFLSSQRMEGNLSGNGHYSRPESPVGPNVWSAKSDENAPTAEMGLAKQVITFSVYHGERRARSSSNNNNSANYDNVYGSAQLKRL